MIVDVGVWLAAVVQRHVHHDAAARWINECDDELAFCRVTQMGLLRLLTNASVMGSTVLSRADAWGVYDSLLADERIGWHAEPAGLDAMLRVFSSHPEAGHKLWTDDYLAAFAQCSDTSLVTLDRRMAARYPSVSVRTLG